METQAALGMGTRDSQCGEALAGLEALVNSLPRNTIDAVRRTSLATHCRVPSQRG